MQELSEQLCTESERDRESEEEVMASVVTAACGEDIEQRSLPLCSSFLYI